MSFASSSSPDDSLVTSADRLAALAGTRLLDSAPEEAFDRVTRLAARVLQVPVVLVSLVDRDRQFFKSQVGLPEPWASACQTPLSHSFCQHVVVRHSPLVIPDARLDPLVRENQAVTDLGVVAYAGVPLATREGHVLGALCAIDGEPRAWTDEDVVVLRDLAALVVTEIELRRSAGAAERRAEEMAALLESTAEGIYGIDLEGNCTFVNRTAARLLGHAPGEMIGQNIHELIHHTRPDGTPYPQAECPIVRASTLGRGCRVDDEVLWRRDGTSFCVEYASSPIRQGNGGAITGTVVAFSDITRRKQTEAELARVHERDHHIAETLQRALLAPAGQDFAGLEIEPIYQAAWEEALIGGDFFDMFSVGDDQIALVVADVSGKGLQAAVHTAEVKYTLRAFLREQNDPARVLARLNNSFCEAQQRDAANKPDNGFPAFVSLALAVVNARSGTATFALAGAEPPLLIRGSGGSSTQPEVVRAEGLPLGVLPGMDYENRVTHLAPGDLILMATDGLTEARHGDKFLGHDGMSDLAQQAMLVCAGAATRNEPATLPRIGQHLVEAARTFAGGKFHDDVCLLLARRPC